MKKTSLFLLIFFLNLVYSIVACGETLRLRGDSRAVASIERMLERLGGREVWANARSLKLEYRVWRTDPDEMIIERAWRDLTQPAQRIEWDSPTEPVTWAFTPESGWVRNKGKIREISAKGHASAVAFWRYDFYTIIRRLAVADTGIRLEFVPPRRVLVKSSAGDDWGWWEIDSTGAPLKWGAVDNEEVLEYVYGPLSAFGDIRFPAWGAAVDGSWRFEYSRIEISTEPLPARLVEWPPS